MHTTPFRRMTLPRWLPAALCGALLAAAATADAGPVRQRQASAKSFVRSFAAEPLATDTLRPQDRAFLDKALELSRTQARLGELGVSQATSTEVRAHAQQLASDNRELTDALSAMARRKGAAATPAPDDKPSPSVQKVAEVTGAEFDRAFVLALVDLHEETTALFERATAESKDADVRDLAAAELPKLREHRNRITELRKRFD